MTAASPFHSTDICAVNRLTASQFSHRAVTLARSLAYARRFHGVSDQVNWVFIAEDADSSNLRVSSIWRQMCVRNGGMPIDATHAAFRHRVITFDEADPYADPLHVYHQQEFRTDGRGLRALPAAPLRDVRRWTADRRNLGHWAAVPVVS